MIFKFLLFAASSLLFDYPHLPWIAENNENRLLTQIEEDEVPILEAKRNEVFFLCHYARIPKVSVS
jgi:hypothetical protein